MFIETSYRRASRIAPPATTPRAAAIAAWDIAGTSRARTTRNPPTTTTTPTPTRSALEGVSDGCRKPIPSATDTAISAPIPKTGRDDAAAAPESRNPATNTPTRSTPTTRWLTDVPAGKILTTPPRHHRPMASSRPPTPSPAHQDHQNGHAPPTVAVTPPTKSGPASATSPTKSVVVCQASLTPPVMVSQPPSSPEPRVGARDDPVGGCRRADTQIGARRSPEPRREGDGTGLASCEHSPTSESRHADLDACPEPAAHDALIARTRRSAATVRNAGGYTTMSACLGWSMFRLPLRGFGGSSRDPWTGLRLQGGEVPPLSTSGFVMRLDLARPAPPGAPPAQRWCGPGPEA